MAFAETKYPQLRVLRMIFAAMFPQATGCFAGTACTAGGCFSLALIGDTEPGR
jgi:hypothetical protein